MTVTFSSKVDKNGGNRGINTHRNRFPLAPNPQIWYIVGMGKKKIQPNPELWDNLGKLLMDLSKLTFASFILGGILKGELPQTIVIGAGSVIFVVFATIGLALTSRKKNWG